MWQIPCKMTNSSSKPLQTLGKWHQPRNPKKNPKPAQKKIPKTISHPQKNDPRRSHNIFKGSQWTLKLRKRSGLCNTPGPWNHPSWSASKIANLRTCLRFLGRSHGSMVYLNQIPWDHGLRPSKIHDGPMVYLNQHHVFFSQEKHVFFANPMVLNVHWPIGWGFDEFDQPTWPDYFQSSSVFFGARAWGVITKIASGLCTKKMGPGEREIYIYIIKGMMLRNDYFYMYFLYWSIPVTSWVQTFC